MQDVALHASIVNVHSVQDPDGGHYINHYNRSRKMLLDPRNIV